MPSLGQGHLGWIKVLDTFFFGGLDKFAITYKVIFKLPAESVQKFLMKKSSLVVSILLVYVGPSQGCRQGGQCHQGGHEGGQVHGGVVIFSVGVYRGSVNYAQAFLSLLNHI